MALDFTHPVHQWLLRISQELGRPWPPDAWLGSVARFGFLRALRAEDERKLDAKLAEMDRIAADFERARAEALALLSNLNASVDAASYVGDDIVRERDSSNWTCHERFSPFAEARLSADRRRR